MMRKKILFFLVVSFSLMAQGQRPVEEQIRVENLSFEKNNNGELRVKAAIVLDKSFVVRTNRGATLTPVLRNEPYAKALPAVIVYGRKRAILSRRNGRTPADAYTVIRRTKGKEQVIDYQVTLPCQTWMPSSQLLLETDLCGCGNATEENYEKLLATVPAFAPVEEKKAETKNPKITFKKRVKENNGHLYFPVNQTSIYADYLNNPEELQKVHKLIEDDDIEYITKIVVHAYASPEGSYPNNIRLAEGRAASLKSYLMKRYQFADSIFQIQSTPEDWQGFRQQVVSSGLADKTVLLDIIDSNKEPDVKEQQLKTLGKTYTYILREWFPVLRHLSYQIEYAIPEENVSTE